jgi:exosortase E/protease (VPEID-CTERM system)
MCFPAWAAVALLALEYALLSVAFDAAPLGRRPDDWALAGHLGWLAVLAAAGAIGAAIVAHADRRQLGRHLLSARPFDARVAALLALHVPSVAGLWWLSARIFAPAGPPGGRAAAWLSLWGLAALATTVSALAAALPGDARRSRALWPLAAGAAIGLAAWTAGHASARLWWPLGPLTLRAVGLVLGALLDDPVVDPSQALVGSKRFPVEVAPSCSGLEGVGLMAVFLGAYLLLARDRLRFPRALLLLPLGLVAAWVANVARLVLLVLVGTFVSEEIAAGGFHAKAGWIFFCAVALSLVLVVQRAGFFAREPDDSGLDGPAAAYLLPFLVLVATSLLTGLVTSHLDLLYGARVLTVVPVLVALRRSYGDLAWSWSWTAASGGIAAAVAFVALAPAPPPLALEGWQQEWGRLPAWGRLAWLAARIVGSVLVVPVAEELAFRGFLLRRVVDRDFTSVPPGRFSPLALIVSSAAFGAIHSGWRGGTVAGLVYGIVQVRGNSVGHAVLAHAVSNAAVALWVVAFDRWWLWV